MNKHLLVIKAKRWFNQQTLKRYKREIFSKCPRFSLLKIITPKQYPKGCTLAVFSIYGFIVFLCIFLYS